MQPEPLSHDDIRQTWIAMQKFCNDEPLAEPEWEALSRLALIDRGRLEFAPDNCRWAATEAERAENLAFYQSLGAPCRGASVIHDARLEQESESQALFGATAKSASLAARDA